MTVADLIEELQKLDGSFEVVVWVEEKGWTLAGIGNVLGVVFIEAVPK